MKALLLVAAGGALGAISRYGTNQLLLRWTGVGHWGTVTANLVGTFLIGILAVVLSRHSTEHLRLLLITGFLGAYTTFSTFNLDFWRMASDGRYRDAGLYLSVSLGGGILALLCGLWLANRVLGNTPG